MRQPWKEEEEEEEQQLGSTDVNEILSSHPLSHYPRCSFLRDADEEQKRIIQESVPRTTDTKSTISGSSTSSDLIIHRHRDSVMYVSKLRHNFSKKGGKEKECRETACKYIDPRWPGLTS